MKITDWPSTHINLVSGWAAFSITIIIGWVVLLLKLDIDQSLYTTLLITTGAWAGVATPAALMLKRATHKPELKETVTTEAGPPAKTTTTTEVTSSQAEDPPKEPPTYVVKPYPREGE